MKPPVIYIKYLLVFIVIKAVESVDNFLISFIQLKILSFSGVDMKWRKMWITEH